MATSCSSFAFGSNILKIWIGPITTSVNFVCHYCFILLSGVFMLATVTGHLLLDLMELIVTLSV